jgi:putative ABC transport system ATP-binding protein
MIIIQEVSKTFFHGMPTGLKALQNITLQIKEGEMIVLAGSNGSGKSTLLNILGGTVTPDYGKIIFYGKDVTQLPEHKRAAWISRIFQNPLAGTAPQLTVAENLRLATLRAQNKKFTIGLNASFKKQMAGKILELQLGLDSKMDTPIGRLSGGQRQALTLLMASLSGAKIILMDEPAAALDPKTANRVMQSAEKIIRENRLAAILVTHHIKDMLRYGNRLLFMSEGRIIKDLSGADKQKLSVNDVVNWFE